MKTIELSKGKSTLVDDDDFIELSKYSWHYSVRGYAARKNKNNKNVYMHRQITDAPQDKVVDHINGDKLDNRRKNLRCVTQQVNSWNIRKPFGEINYVGVSKPKTKWPLKKPYRASICASGESIWLGRFSTAEEASEAYQAAKKIYHV